MVEIRFYINWKFSNLELFTNLELFSKVDEKIILFSLKNDEEISPSPNVSK